METTPMIEKLKSKLLDHTAWWIPPNTASSKNNKEIMTMSIKSCVYCGGYVEPQKGSQRICGCGAKYNVGFCAKCGKEVPRKTATFLQNSDRVKEYIVNAKPTYQKYMKEFWNVIATYPKPIYLGMYFIRDSNRAWDFPNIQQIIFDLIKIEKDGQPNWIPDDDTKNIIGVYLGEHVADPIDTKGKTKEEVEKLRNRRFKEKTGVVLTVMHSNYRDSLINYL
jgi:hypothetical protein